MLGFLMSYVGRRAGGDPLLRDQHFRRYWLSAGLNGFATQISGLSIPLCAAVLLGASPTQMGLLVAMQSLPFGLLGLPAGVWLDRRRKRPILFASKLMATAALMSVPAAYWLGILTIPWLYCVAFTIGLNFLVGGSAEQILLVGIVGRDGVLPANARFASTDSISRLLGPGIAGLLVQLVTAPFAILVTACIMTLSMTVMRTVRFSDPPPGQSERHPLRDMLDGLLFIRRHAVLLPLACGIGTWNLLFSAYLALNVMYATRTLGLSPGALGLAEAAGGAGILASSVLAPRLTGRLGAGRTILAGMAATTVATLALAALPARLLGSTAATGLAYACALMLRDFGVMVTMLPYMAVRQRVTPDAYLGRVIATMRCMTVLLAPVGALAAGLCAEQLDVRPTLLVIGLAGVCLAVVLGRSPIPRIS